MSTETIRYSQLGKEDLALGKGTREVRLADGTLVSLSEIDVGSLLNDSSLSTQTLSLASVTLSSTLTVSGATALQGLTATSLTLGDDEPITLGTGSDATIAYDGADLVITPAAVGSGDVVLSGGRLEVDDDEGVAFGTGNDALINYNGTDLVISPAVVGSGDVYISGGSLEVDDNEAVRFGTGKDASIFYDGTNLVIQPQDVGSGDVVINDAAILFLNDTANANMSVGLTIDQGTNDDQIFCLKSSSDVAHSISTIPNGSDVETDDYFTISKSSAAVGGAKIRAFMESTFGGGVFDFECWGGAPATSDSSGSVGAIHFRAGQHDGANGRADMAANSNLFTVAEIDSSGVNLTRLLLKADDGELHLGNTTLVALDDYDDCQLVQAMRYTSSTGIKGNEWEVPIYSYDTLHRIGVLGPKDENGECLFAVQPRFAMNEGAIWQLHKRALAQEQRIEQLETTLKQIGHA